MSVHIVNIYKRGYDVYIGRPGKKQAGIFGNPVILGKECPVCGEIHKSSGTTLPCYEQYLDEQLQNDPNFLLEFMKLVNLAYKAGTRRDKLVLGCFCKPAPCHGDVLASKIMKYLGNNREAP